MALKPLNAKEVLLFLIDEGFHALQDLKEVEDKGKLTPFQFGLRTATVAYMEVIQRWEEAKENGLDFDLEEAYPV